MSELNPRTRAFVLLRELIKTSKLSEAKTYELTEIITEMASKATEHPVERLEAKLDAVNTKYNVLIWAIGFAGLIISLAIIFGDKIGN